MRNYRTRIKYDRRGDINLACSLFNRIRKKFEVIDDAIAAILACCLPFYIDQQHQRLVQMNGAKSKIPQKLNKLQQGQDQLPAIRYDDCNST